ncbi:unnamed protein product [Ambrosiozyma monospora]|uniref:Unnamed protein product n=1 Tax=Ambrosiozyma monospora TaxID=43982 RepID=A0ACB5T1R8_AMBMO|nr:unnamed protein product [Ambrosiozyma monospora]
MKFSNVVSLITFAFLTSAAPVVYVTNTSFVDQNGTALDGQSTPHIVVGTSDVEKSSLSLSRRSGSGSFQEGTIACSQFPSVDHVVSTDWLGLGGWTSIVNEYHESSSECKDGFHCSYTCEPGYARSQWPSDGGSLGGLYCKNGHLYKSNTNSDSLCTKGTGGAFLKSELSDNVAICMSEGQGFIPTNLEGGATSDIFVPDESYYKVPDQPAPASFYYINNAGVSVKDACVSSDGNSAPLMIGTGHLMSSRGQMVPYVSMRTNPLSSKKTANFKVAIEAPAGGQISGNCTYENGEVRDDIGKIPGDDGICTVNVLSGFAVIRFYN